MTATAPFQTPLQDYQLFASTSIDEAREFVGNVFCPHQLTPSKHTTRLDAQMHHARVSDRSSLNFLKYGAQVTVEPGVLENFFLVQIQLSGNVSTRCGHQIENICAGDAAVLSPSEYVSMDWKPDSSMLIYRADRNLVEQKLSALLCDELSDPIVFETRMNHQTNSGAGWLRAARFLLDELEGNTGFLNYPNAAENFEENLILSLLYGQQHNYSHQLLNGTAKAAPAHVKRVEAYILANAVNAVSIEDLTHVSQVSARALFSAFRDFRGTSPMRYLRRVRLENVRRDLLGAPGNSSVTEIACRWGFVQLGRFSGEYRQRYGELPSETLRRIS